MCAWCASRYAMAGARTPCATFRIKNGHPSPLLSQHNVRLRRSRGHRFCPATKKVSKRRTNSPEAKLSMRAGSVFFCPTAVSDVHRHIKHTRAGETTPSINAHTRHTCSAWQLSAASSQRTCSFQRRISSLFGSASNSPEAKAREQAAVKG